MLYFTPHRRSACAVLLLSSFSLTAIPASRTQAAAAAGRQQTAQIGKLRGGALATFDVHGERFRVWVTNAQTIGQLQALRDGNSTAHIPNGRILRGPGKDNHNRPWRWHLDPNDIQMADVTTEVCDGTPSYVNQHLKAFIHTVKRYCPWNAKLVALRVVPPIPTPATVPTAPTDLRVVAVEKGTTSAEQTTVTLQWQDNSGNETGFRVRASFSHFYGGGGAQIQNIGANTTSARIQFVAGGFNPVKQACFSVTAVNNAGESARSNEVCAEM